METKIEGRDSKVVYCVWGGGATLGQRVVALSPRFLEFQNFD